MNDNKETEMKDCAVIDDGNIHFLLDDVDYYFTVEQFRKMEILVHSARLSNCGTAYIDGNGMGHTLYTK